MKKYDYNNGNMLDWNSFVKTHISIIDIPTLKWIDFRANWHVFNKQKLEELLNDYEQYQHQYQYYWGVKEGWHTINKNGKIVGTKKSYLTEDNYNDL